MADIHVIRVGLDGADENPSVLPKDVVVWVPATTHIKVKIKFQKDSPFARRSFPTVPSAGGVVKGTVKDDAAPGEYAYDPPGSQRRKRRGARPLGDPVIIVRDTFARKAKKKKGGQKNVARKK